MTTSTAPVYAVAGEPFVTGMVKPLDWPPEVKIGWVSIEDEVTRLIVSGSDSLPSSPVQSNAARDGFVLYVCDASAMYPPESARPVHPKGKYLDYAGHIVVDPVNQWVTGRAWMKACGVFASHISAFRGDDHMLAQAGTYDSGHALVHSDESIMRHKVTMWWGRGLNGEACRQLAHYMPPGTIVADPEIGLDPVITEQTPTDKNWKIVEATIADTMRIICDDCQGFNILRRFQRRCQPFNFLTSLNNGMVVAPNFEDEEWGPRAIVRNFSFEGRARRIEIHDELMAWNDRALTYFDENIAPDATHL